MDLVFERLEGVILKLNKAVSRFKQIGAKNLELEKRVRELESIIANQDKKIQALTVEAGHLKLADQVISGNGNAQASKQKINEFIKEIDHCLALLNREDSQ